jgi:hypothetical protein
LLDHLEFGVVVAAGHLPGDERRKGDQRC